MPKAEEVQAAAIEQATLDEFMRRDPALLTEVEKAEMIVLQRHARSRFIKAEAERKNRKKEKEDE